MTKDMGLFDAIFGRKKAEPQESAFQTLTAYQPAFRTWGGQIATLNDGRPVEMAARNFSASLDGAIDRQLGDVGLTLFNAPRREQQIEVRQVLPLPMTILALLVETN